MQSWSPSGLPNAPQLRWGSHLAHFFNSGEELRDLLVPYFKAGLENNERCLWVTGKDFGADDARAALAAAVPDLARREREQQIEIADGGQWYATGQKLHPQELVDGLLQREEAARGLGYTGLRTAGNCAWVGSDQWADFQAYEGLVQEAMAGRRMICLCSYCSDRLEDGRHLDVMGRHDMTLPARAPRSRRLSVAERDQRTFDLAMTASQMGTWRYTMADNICIYDEHAQRLYGLSEGRFLHDDEGVKAKFHPDDMDLMWSRVAKALEPGGDGRYDVEYRVKQPDGSWRWLSAWGLVEFEGEGAERKPVAISGASRDLTERKKAEDLQRMLLNELNHRVKNTFATIQAMTVQTLRTAKDLPAARDVLEHRIRSMARAHDLLTVRSWTGADVTEIVMRALDAFSPAQLAASGPAVQVSSKHALSLSMALHELATNATKYGALSSPQGRVNVQWVVDKGLLRLDWEESGGPPVVPPARKGFGSQLLEQILASDLGGHAVLNYDPKGVRCAITARLEAVQ